MGVQPDAPRTTPRRPRHRTRQPRPRRRHLHRRAVPPGLLPPNRLHRHQRPTAIERFPRGEAVHYREHALTLGVPDEAILVEPNATNTGENIDFTRALVKGNNPPVRSVMLISRPYQQRRAYAMCRSRWPDVVHVPNSTGMVPPVSHIRVHHNEVDYGPELIFTRNGELFTGFAFDEEPGGPYEIEYRNGLQHGVSRWWYPDRTIAVVEHFYENVRHGPSCAYDEQGALRRTTLLKYGVVIEEWERGPTGQMTSSGPIQISDCAANRLERLQRTLHWPELWSTVDSSGRPGCNPTSIAFQEYRG